jgi:hypothetical protein
MARITGLSLAASAAGTISLNGGGGDVALPASLQWTPYAGNDSGDGQIDLDDAVEVSVVPAGTLSAALLVSVTKANGDDPATFAITLTNDDGANATPALEIFLRYKS